MKLIVWASLQNCSMDNIYQKQFFTGTLKNLFKFSNHFQKKNPRRSSRSQVFYKIGVLKKFANFTRKHQCWSRFLIKSPEIMVLHDRCFPVNFAKLLRTPFLQNSSSGVGICLIKSFTLQAFTKMFLNGQLQTNSYLMAKTICTFLVFPFSL